MKLNNHTFSLLPRKMQAAVKEMRTKHNVPDEMLIPVVLSVANFAAQALYDVDAKYSDRSPLSLYMVILSESGSRKSTILNDLLKGASEFVEEEAGRVRRDRPAYKARYKLWEDEFKKAIKDGTTLPTEPDPMVGDDYILQKATLNGLMVALSTTPHTGLINADAGEFFNSHAFQDKKSGRAEEMITSLSKLYSGEWIQRQTGMGDDTNVKLYHRRFCMIALLQEQMAGFLTNDNYNDQGFIPRMLVTKVPPMKVVFAKLADTDKLIATPGVDAFSARIKEMLEIPGNRTTANVPQDGGFKALHNAAQAYRDPLQVHTDVLTIDKDAYAILDAYNLRTADLANGENTGLKAFYIRRFDSVIRIAGTLAAFDGETSITKHHAEASIGLMEWFTVQRQNLDVVDNSKDEIVKGAEKMVEWAKKHNTTAISHRDLQRLGPYTYRKMNSDNRKRVLDELVSRGEIEVEEIDSPKVTRGVSVQITFTP